jgi:RNA polymerase sigma-70 factor (ECF subfamily)
MQDLVEQYKNTRKVLRAIRTLNTNEVERKVIGGMISDCDYVLQWLRTGRRPGNRRGIERLAAYQREKPIDPLHIQKYFQAVGGDPFQKIGIERIDTITQADRERLEDAMCELTNVEKEYYMLHHGYGFSYAAIANMFCVTKGTVQTTVERAEKKIKKRINESLFCW